MVWSTDGGDIHFSSFIQSSTGFWLTITLPGDSHSRDNPQGLCSSLLLLTAHNVCQGPVTGSDTQAHILRKLSLLQREERICLSQRGWQVHRCYRFLLVCSQCLCLPRFDCSCVCVWVESVGGVQKCVCSCVPVVVCHCAFLCFFAHTVWVYLCTLVFVCMCVCAYSNTYYCLWLPASTNTMWYWAKRVI